MTQSPKNNSAFCSWSGGKDSCLALYRAIQKGIAIGIFGDIDLEAHREWEEKVCGKAGLEPLLPLWKCERQKILDEFLAVGFTAIVVATNEEKLGKEFLGRTLDAGLIEEFKAHGIDASGEEGEYHTVVVDGPIFSEPLTLVPGENQFHSGYWFKDFSLKN